MKTCLVRLGSKEDVKHFIRIVSEVSYSVRIIEGPRSVNAKSEMEVFSLNLTKPFKVCPEVEDADLFGRLAPSCLSKGGKKGGVGS